jgi:aspartyl-tRNA(Asn)/glutamyl-tRNA(Gln) amidotransferase subunit A
VEAASNLHRFDGVKYGYRTSVNVEDLQDLIRRTRAEGFGSEAKLRILMGMYLSSEGFAANYYQRALKVRAMIRRDFDRAFDPHGEHRLDVVLTPTTATTAFKRNDIYGNTVRMQYSDQMTVSANHAGLPAVSVPGGLDADNLPIGIQFIGPDFREDLILRPGYAYEQATQGEAWRAVRPAVLRQEVAK